MGFRFQRRVRIAPGIRLNFSTRGMSTTIGPRGASINLGRSGVHANLGVPGTGISFRERLDQPVPRPRVPPAVPSPQPIELQAGYLGHEEVASATDVSSATLADLATCLRETRHRRQKHLDEYRRVGRTLSWSFFKIDLAAIATLGGLLFKGLLPRLSAEREGLLARRRSLLAEIAEEHLELDAELSDEARLGFERLRSAFGLAAKSARVWDVTSQAQFDRRTTRSYASTSVNRILTTLEFATLEDLPVQGDLLCFRNKNGADIYVSPVFLATWGRGTDVALLDFAHLKVEYSQMQFVESQQVPMDSQVIGAAWEKSNKDGTPDRRFASNRQFPILSYGELRLRSTTGLNECFLFSNEAVARDLASALSEYAMQASRSADA